MAKRGAPLCMGDDYFSAYELITCVKDVVDSISCDAAINRVAHCYQCLYNMQVHFGRAKSVVYVLQHAVFFCDSVRSLG
jgi:hypothetical protein